MLELSKDRQVRFAFIMSAAVENPCFEGAEVVETFEC